MSDKEIRLGFPGNVKKIENPFPADAPPAWGVEAKLDVVGKDHARIDARAKVTGAAKFAYDRHFKGMVYARMLRSPHAAARVQSIDLNGADKMAGVVFHEVYNNKRIRYAGDSVVAFAAETEDILDDALARIKVDYDVLPHAVTVDDALDDGAPSVATGGNERKGRPRGNAKRVEEAHKSADVVVEQEYRTQVQTHSCLETHGCVCVFKDGKLTAYASTQATFAFRGTLARALKLDASKVTVITEHMGGGFGSKFGADAWDVFCAKVAVKTGRPCKSMLDRRAEHMIAGNRPDSIQKCKFSAKKDGTLMGAAVTSWGTAGVSPRGGGVYNPAIYKFQSTFHDGRDVLTNAGRARAFRAPRHPQGVFALEGMIDELADAVGMDPLAFRVMNDTHPVRQAQYPIGAKEIGWERRKKTGTNKGAVRRGIGMAASRWPHTGRPGSSVRCRIGKDGSVVVANGAQDIGTGTRTVLAILAAEELGLKPKQITVQLGNTNDPPGPASGGSTTTPTITPPTRKAVVLAKRQLLSAVADVVGGDVAKMDLKDGKVVGARKAITIQQRRGRRSVRRGRGRHRHRRRSRPEGGRRARLRPRGEHARDAQPDQRRHHPGRVVRAVREPCARSRHGRHAQRRLRQLQDRGFDRHAGDRRHPVHGRQRHYAFRRFESRGAGHGADRRGGGQRRRQRAGSAHPFAPDYTGQGPRRIGEDRMKNFTCLQAQSFAAAAKALATGDEMVVKGAGTDLLDLLKSRTLQPETVVSLLSVKDQEQRGEISALATLNDIAEDEWVRLEFPALQMAAAVCATPQIRNVATLGGNLAQTTRCWYLRTPGHECIKLGGEKCAAAAELGENRYSGVFASNGCHCAHPSNLAPALIALKASVYCVHPDGDRAMDVGLIYDEVKRGRMSDLGLRPGELIRSVLLNPSPLATNSVYFEFRERQSFDFAVASVAAAADIRNGKVEEIRIVCGGVAPTPLRLVAAEQALTGKKLDPEVAAAAAVKGATPLAQNKYKLPVLAELVRRACREIAS